MNFEELKQRNPARSAGRVFAAALVLAVWAAGAGAAAGQRGGRRRQGPPPPPKPLQVERPPDLGRVVGSTYANDYFGLSFDVPEGWTVGGAGAGRQIEERAKGIFRDEQDARIKRELEAAVERTTTLLSASKFPPGEPRPFNATLVCAAELVPTALVKTPEDYYRLSLHSLRLSKELEIQVVEPFRAKTIGGASFGVYTMRLAFNLGVILQKQLIMVRGPYVFGLAFAYTDEADAATFDRILASVRVTGSPKTGTR